MAARLTRWRRLWFTLSEPVDARTYFRHGAALMIFKYVVDASVIGLVLGRFWSPLDYLTLPSIFLRADILGRGPDWLLWVIALWTLPFVWIGVAMTLRRAVDAGQSAWLCLVFFVPIVNYVLMLVLSALPTENPTAWRRHDPAPQREAQLRSAFAGVAAGVVAALLVLVVSVFLVRRYGEGLFFGAPLILGMVSAFVYWKMLADAIISRIHLRVLTHVKALSEQH